MHVTSFWMIQSCFIPYSINPFKFRKLSENCDRTVNDLVEYFSPLSIYFGENVWIQSSRPINLNLGHINESNSKATMGRIYS